MQLLAHLQRFRNLTRKLLMKAKVKKRFQKHMLIYSYASDGNMQATN